MPQTYFGKPSFEDKQSLDSLAAYTGKPDYLSYILDHEGIMRLKLDPTAPDGVRVDPHMPRCGY